jgi:hypothetical protein
MMQAQPMRDKRDKRGQPESGMINSHLRNSIPRSKLADEENRSRKEEDMIKLDFEGALKMARADLPEGWMIEIHLEKEISLVGLFPPNGARIEFDTTGMTMTAQMLKAIALAKASNTVFLEGRKMRLKSESRSKKQM